MHHCVMLSTARRAPPPSGMAPLSDLDGLHPLCTAEVPTDAFVDPMSVSATRAPGPRLEEDAFLGAPQTRVCGHACRIRSVSPSGVTAASGRARSRRREMPPRNTARRAVDSGFVATPSPAHPHQQNSTLPSRSLTPFGRVGLIVAAEPTPVAVSAQALAVRQAAVRRVALAIAASNARVAKLQPSDARSRAQRWNRNRNLALDRSI